MTFVQPSTKLAETRARAYFQTNNVETARNSDKPPMHSGAIADGDGLVVSGSASESAPFTASVARHTAGTIPIEETLEETGAARELHYTAIETVDGKELTEQELFKDGPSDLIIGVDTTGRTKGHMYLIIDGTRIDGRMFFRPHTEDGEHPVLSGGLAIRYKKLPPAIKKRLVAWVKGEEEIHRPTCVASAIEILYDKGGLANPPKKKHWFPNTYLKHLARHGLTGPDGKRLESDICTINEDIHMFWNNLPTWLQVPRFIFKVWRNG